MTRPLLALALLLSAALTAPPPTPRYCPVVVYRDYDLFWAYYAQPRLTRSCPPSGEARVRKVSTLSTRKDGHPYQPIRPETGAWTVTWAGDDIPSAAQFTLTNWDWEYWTGKAWRVAVVQ